MVEHMSAAPTPTQQSSPYDGPARWELDVASSSSSAPGQRFSLLRWFRQRRRNNSTSSADSTRRPPPRQQFFRRKKQQSRRPSVSSCSSSDDSYSTATVKSFAYHSGRRDAAAVRAALRLEPSSCAVGPFAPGAVKLRGVDTSTLPTAFSQRQGIQTRYLLHPFNNSFVSFDNIPFIDTGPRAFPETRGNKNNVTVVVDVDHLTSDSSASVVRKVHVKGKRRAPDPPAASVHVTEKGSNPGRSRRKRRPAPKPPGYSSNQDTLSSEASVGMEAVLTPRECAQIISNDTLVLRRGVLLAKKVPKAYDSEEDPTSASTPVKVGMIMPRPWYKRTGEHSNNSSLRRNNGDIMRGIPSPLPVEVKDEHPSSASNSPTVALSFPFEGSLSRLSFFHRDRYDDKKKENKRKSGVSILTNISELDKEAAAIVQEEQARNRASMILQAAKLDEEFERRMGANKEIVEEIVNASMENSPRRSTRALISKFNAIGNITKVTVNSNFFTRNSSASPKPKNKRFSHDVRRDNYLDDCGLGRDLTKYFADPKRESIFTELVQPKPEVPKPSVEITTISLTPKSNAEFVNTLAAELDDVATGIARLRQELDQRPKLKDSREAVPHRKLDAARDKELANFDREFTKIFSEIDRQLRTEPKTGNKVSRNQQAGSLEKHKPKIVEIPVDKTPETRKTVGEYPKPATKVSSGVQTSGNVRRVADRSDNAYANALERRSHQERKKIDLPQTTDLVVNVTRKNDRRDEEEKLEEAKRQYMNTMAVNRLLRKLEAAIASGNHQQAAVLARELAQLKIHCSVVRQRSSSSGAKDKLNLKMYIEDKQAHQGPIPLQLPLIMTVAQLKAKIQIEFEIPANVQRWIIGKNLADNDESTLEELQALEGSPVFLYIVAPPDVREKEAIKTGAEHNAEKIKEKAGKEEEPPRQLFNDNNEEKIHDTKPEIESGAVQLVEVVEEREEEARSEAEAKAEPPNRETKEGSVSKEEKLLRYEELMSLENCDVIANTEPIECPVCFMFVVEGEGVILRDCLHSFCRSCVANVVRYCDEAEVRCPYRDAEYTCDSTLQEREIKALVPAEVYQQHLDKSIAQAENNAGNNAFHCKTPDCPGWCIYDDNVNNFLCPVCNATNCLTCQAIHMGKNCRQYQEELKYSKDTDHESKRTAAMLEEMVDRGEALPCPTCAVVLMKKWGCDWLRCSMCKTEICWVTRGPRWGPAGKGDTSGGCKCGENGVKCHPRCNYCH